jgi:hypothetical protein
LVVDGRIILKCDIRKQDGREWPKIVADSCDDGNKTSCSIKLGEFLDLLSNYHLLKKDQAL